MSKIARSDSNLGKDLVHGFFQIMSKDEASIGSLLMLNPHISKWETCIMQPWVSGFNPAQPTNALIPVWITLTNLPDELRSSGEDIAMCIGQVIRRNKSNSICSDQKYCVTIFSSKPFVMAIDVTNPIFGTITKIEVDYINLPIRCRLCFSIDHLAKDCDLNVVHDMPKRDRVKRPNRAANANANKSASASQRRKQQGNTVV
jgi:hypothetical protein